MKLGTRVQSASTKCRQVYACEMFLELDHFVVLLSYEPKKGNEYKLKTRNACKKPYVCAANANRLH